MRRITIKDVAERAGVSTTTVSRILNNKRAGLPISNETRERVLQVAREMDFSPNLFARGLKTRCSKTLGIAVQHLATHLEATIAEAASVQARKKGYRALVTTLAGSQPLEEAAGISMEGSATSVDGLLVVGEVSAEQVMEFGFSTGRPHLVSVLGGIPAGRVASFNIDNRAGFSLAAEYLLELGHHDVAFLGSETSWDTRERLEAYRGCVAEGRFVERSGYVRVAENTALCGAELTRELLALTASPTAIICATDILALGALRALADSSIDVPSRVSVLGFDDHPFSPFLSPPLTTVSPPVEAVAARAIDLLVAMLEGDFDPWLLTNSLVRPALVVRRSCAVAARRTQA